MYCLFMKTKANRERLDHSFVTFNRKLAFSGKHYFEYKSDTVGGLPGQVRLQQWSKKKEVWSHKRFLSHSIFFTLTF